MSVVLSHTWIPGIFLRRYKRFLVDVLLESGEAVCAHCPNTGAMRGLLVPGQKVFLSYEPSAKRKLAYTWQAVLQGETMVGVNTHLPNVFVGQAFAKKVIPALRKFALLKKEVAVGSGTRLDFLLSSLQSHCYLEVKNVHYQEKGVAIFPDSPTERGQRHLQTLMRLVEQGNQAMVLYVVQRPDVYSFSLESSFDCRYAEIAEKAHRAGVQFLACSLLLTLQSVAYEKILPLVKQGS